MACRVKSLKLNEAQFTRLVIDMARLFGWRVAHFRTVRVQRKDGSFYYETPVQGDGAGFPDLLLIKGDVGIVAELKVGKNRLTDAQASWIVKFNKVGFRVYEWRPKDLPEIERILK